MTKGGVPAPTIEHLFVSCSTVSGVTEAEAAKLVHDEWWRLEWHHPARPTLVEVAYAKLPNEFGFIEIEQTYRTGNSTVRFRVSNNAIHSGPWVPLGEMPSVR